MGVATNRAKYFIECNAPNAFTKFIEQNNFREIILNTTSSKWESPFTPQLSLF